MSMMAYRYSDRCLVCSRWQNTFPCKHCECSYYCSIECQVVDLPVHRTLCKSFAQFECDLAPAKRRAIYLPVDGPPQFVWLEMDESAHYDQPDFPAMLKNFLGYSKNYATFSIQQDMVSMAKTYYDQCIMLLYASDQTYTDQPLNKSISTLLGKSAHGVRGPVLAFGQIAHEWEDGQQDLFVTDLDTTDLPIITNWFLGIHREVEVTISCVSAFSHCEQRKSGLRFNCAFMHARFVFCSGLWGTMSQISVIFGMPLMVLIDTQGPNCDRSPEEQKRLEEIVAGLPPDSGNRAVALLLIYMGNHTETADEDFGTIPERYRSQLGSAVVFRKDLKPFEPDYLEAFCDWIEDDLLPKFTDANKLIKHALDNEVDDENRRRLITTIKQNMWNRCSRKEFRMWCKQKGIHLSAL